METYLNKGIKEVITEFPSIEGILEDYEIGCGPCMVGTCLLKDIVEIHQLPPEQEQELMARIQAVLVPGSPVPLPIARKAERPAKQQVKHSPPIRTLMEEHALIKRWLDLIPQMVDRLDLDTAPGRQVVADGIDLIRSYADAFHHAKEEDILFSVVDDSAEIFQVIYKEHRLARDSVTAMRAAVDANDRDALAAHLTAYRELLASHIRKEDEILFPWIDSKLTDTQVGELAARFAEADKQSGVMPQRYQVFIRRLETTFAEKE